MTSYLTLSPPVGLYRNGTIYQAKGRWYDANLMRFQQDQVKPIGGWQPRSSAGGFNGIARCALSWRDDSNNNWIAVGTSGHLYIQDPSGANHDITPLRRTTRGLGSNPLSATIGSPVVVVTDSGHDAAVGDAVTLSGATTFAGLSASALNQSLTVLASPAPTSTTYAVNVGASAASTTTGGGAGVTATYDFRPLATNPFTTTSGSPTIRVSHATHGAVVGDTVIFSGATPFAGFNLAQLNTGFVVQTVIDANTYTIAAHQNATSGTSGGGSAVRAEYELSSITSGRADATRNLSYGGNTYGAAFYGQSRPATGAFLPATVWSLDAWGKYLVACSDADGSLYQWTLDPNAHAIVLPGAPTQCAGLVVTQEFFLFALGASGDGRKIAWCDQQNNTLWTPAATNQAGDYDLPTVGTLQCGKALPSGALCFTDVDVWRASYLGAPLVYGFERVGSGCGVISKGAVAAVDSTAVWMGPGPVFWVFDGQSVKPLDCDVLDCVSDMNPNQTSKVTAVHVALFGEIWWFFPSTSSMENDTYVCWCYRESERFGRNVWTFGKLARTCGTGKGVFTNPLMVDSSGILYLHESGLNWGGAQPYIESGPVEIGDGERMAEIQRIIPDEQQDGAFIGQLFGRLWPDGSEFSSASFTLASPTPILFQAREIRIRFTLNAAVSGRIGAMRLEVVQGDPM